MSDQTKALTSCSFLPYKEHGGSSSEQTTCHSTLQHSLRTGEVGPLSPHDPIPQGHWLRGDGNSTPNTNNSGVVHL